MQTFHILDCDAAQIVSAISIYYKDRTVCLSIRVMNACDGSTHSAGQTTRPVL